jgi:Region found in RelA / SpoT proteins
VTLSISKSALNRIGDRIAQQDPPSQVDLDQLNAILLEYDAHLAIVVGQLALLGFSPGFRVKTKDVLIEKLRREDKMELARVQDLAGARVVIEGTRVDQDIAVAQIVDHFRAFTGAEVKPYDRRANPSHGYRAVHIVVKIDGVPIEIQVRTHLQNGWAQAIENFARSWGRGIRYGLGPDKPNESVGGGLTRRELFETLISLADHIDKIEKHAIARGDLLQRLDKLVDTMRNNARKTSKLSIPLPGMDSYRDYVALRESMKDQINVMPLCEVRVSRRRYGRFIRRSFPLPRKVGKRLDMARATEGFIAILSENREHLDRQHHESNMQVYLSLVTLVEATAGGRTPS